jgi:hypothetical protein
MSPALWKQLFLGGVGERQVPNIVAKRSHPQDVFPIRKGIGISQVWQEALNFIRYVRGFCNYLKGATREFHDAQ